MTSSVRDRTDSSSPIEHDCGPHTAPVAPGYSRPRDQDQCDRWSYGKPPHRSSKLVWWADLDRSCDGMRSARCCVHVFGSELGLTAVAQRASASAAFRSRWWHGRGGYRQSAVWRTECEVDDRRV